MVFRLAGREKTLLLLPLISLAREEKSVGKLITKYNRNLIRRVCEAAECEDLRRRRREIGLIEATKRVY